MASIIGFLPGTMSNYLVEEREKSVTNYGLFDGSCPINFQGANYDLLQLYEEVKPIDYLSIFAREFSTINWEDLLSQSNSKVVSFFGYLTTCINTKMIFPLSAHWPPLLPRVHDTIEPFGCLIARIPSQVTNPDLFIRAICRSIFPKVWTVKSCFVNSALLAISKCTIPGSAHNFWAVLDKEKTFKLFKIGSKALGEHFSCIPSKVCASPDRKTIHVLDANSIVVSEFVPIEADHIDLWDVLYTKTKIPFPVFFSTSEKFFPDIMYKAFYLALTSNDQFILQAILQCPDIDENIWKNNYYIYSHNKRITTLIQNVVISELSPQNIDVFHIFDQSSHFKSFLQAFAQFNLMPYCDSFLFKIIQLIDGHNDLNITSWETCNFAIVEKLFFNVLKLISQSIAFVPNQIKHLCSILRSYTSIRFNNRTSVFLIMAGFIGKLCIIPVLNNPNTFWPNIVIQNPQNLQSLAKLLEVPFSGSIFEGQFSMFAGWNKRLEKHAYPQLDSFLFALGDFKSPQDYPIPNNDVLGLALDSVMRYVIEKAKPYLRGIIISSSDPKIQFESVPGWNLAAFVSDCYSKNFDKTISVSVPQKQNKPRGPSKAPPLKLPSLPMFTANSTLGLSQAKSLSKIPSFVSKPDDMSSVASSKLILESPSIKPQLFPTRDIRISDSPIIPSSPIKTMKLPTIPPTSKYNPIRIDKTKYEEIPSDEALTLQPLDIKEKPHNTPKPQTPIKLTQQKQREFESVSDDDLENQPKPKPEAKLNLPKPVSVETPVPKPIPKPIEINHDASDENEEDIKDQMNAYLDQIDLSDDEEEDEKFVPVSKSIPAKPANPTPQSEEEEEEEHAEKGQNKRKKKKIIKRTVKKNQDVFSKGTESTDVIYKRVESSSVQSGTKMKIVRKVKKDNVNKSVKNDEE